jgi:plasmid maintenance system antidote protein VapI
MAKPKLTEGCLVSIRFLEQLLEVMEAKGLSKSDLARALGVDRSRITKVLGVENMTINTMVRLAEAVGMGVEVTMKEKE